MPEKLKKIIQCFVIAGEGIGCGVSEQCDLGVALSIKLWILSPSEVGAQQHACLVPIYGSIKDHQKRTAGSTSVAAQENGAVPCRFNKLRNSGFIDAQQLSNCSAQFDRIGTTQCVKEHSLLLRRYEPVTRAYL